MLDKVKQILSELFECDTDSITEDTDLVLDLGLSSFQLMGLVTYVEDEFGIAVNDRDIPNIHTVGDVARYLEKAI